MAVDIAVTPGVPVGVMSTHALRAYRNRHNITLTDFAARVGRSRQSIWRIEMGRQMPSPGLIKRMVSESGGELCANDFFPEESAA